MLSNKKLFLFDIDGTVCQGERLIDGTMQFLEDIRQRGGQFVFIKKKTNKKKNKKNKKKELRQITEILSQHPMPLFII